MSNEIEKKPGGEVTRYDSKHIEAIEHFLVGGGEGIELNDLEKRILDRLRFADEKIRENQGILKRDEIANLIRSKYGVSRPTAYWDMVNAERVFSSSYPLNKSYEIGLRIEFVKEQIRLASIEKDFGAVAKLEKVLHGYYDIYPDIQPQRVKKNIILNVIQNNLSTDSNTEAMSLQDAIIIAEKENENE